MKNLLERLKPEYRTILENSDSVLKDTVIYRLSLKHWSTDIEFDTVCHLYRIIFDRYKIEPLKVYELFED